MTVCTLQTLKLSIRETESSPQLTGGRAKVRTPVPQRLGLCGSSLCTRVEVTEGNGEAAGRLYLQQSRQKGGSGAGSSERGLSGRRRSCSGLWVGAGVGFYSSAGGGFLAVSLLQAQYRALPCVTLAARSLSSVSATRTAW